MSDWTHSTHQNFSQKFRQQRHAKLVAGKALTTYGTRHNNVDLTDSLAGREESKAIEPRERFNCKDAGLPREAIDGEELSPKQRRVLRAKRRVNKRPEKIEQDQKEIGDDSTFKKLDFANAVKNNGRGKNLSAKNHNGGRQVKFELNCEQSPIDLEDIKPKKRTKAQFDLGF